MVTFASLLFCVLFFVYVIMFHELVDKGDCPDKYRDNR